ncbi:sterol desaturase family protein [Pedobacter changchengzhani]|uniref:Sterol desaturase family protein n=1 Tax=Pedobacter changchengzhani TaxID=2529274 RepID=A0A4R5MKG8_9SPHI|nr:sterol desaturase family protein [Pedobacter changchengzhani]TDG36164.1 sterol desaturase family protein [Pedobacter changchengzhani]
MNPASSHSTNLQLLFFAVIMVALWHSEMLFNEIPLKEKWKHAVLNLQFLLTATFIQLPLSLAVIKVSALAEINSWGIYNHLPNIPSFWIKFLIGFLMLDFCEYAYHFVMHKISFLWKMHLIHHTDKFVNVSTTVREHPGETFIRVSFMIVVVFVTGIPIEILLIRQFIQSFSNVVSHTSMSLPKKLEKWLGYILITPSLHKVHHHDKMPYTDSNYGDILCIWDRLFGTYRELELSKINFGVDTVKDEHVATFSKLVAYPFSKFSKKTPVNMVDQTTKVIVDLPKVLIVDL